MLTNMISRKKPQRSVGPVAKLAKKKPNPFKKRILIGLLASLFLLLVLGGGVFAARAYLAFKKVVKDKKEISAPGLKGDLDLSNLKAEGEGRVNILLLGVGDQGHAGELLTDTMIFASIDPKTKEVVMVSLPRDLYVKIPGYWWSRINAAHAFSEQDKAGTGPETAKKVVSDVLGQPVHYFVRVDFSGLRQAVDALNGIDIYNESDLNDPDYPCDKNEGLSCGFKLKAGYYHMDGNLALKYSRCRKGNCGDDFGRGARQQAVTVAMRDQALKLGNILNPVKVSDLVTIIGDHLKTDLSADEIKRLVELSKKINANTVKNKVIDGGKEGLVKTTNIDGASVVIPLAGIGNYKDIRAFVASYLLDGYVVSEAAKITIQSTGAKPGAVMALASRLRSLGYQVAGVSTAVSSNQPTKLINLTGNAHPYTLQYLGNRLRVAAELQDKQKDQSSDIIIMLGDDYEPKNNN